MRYFHYHQLHSQAYDAARNNCNHFTDRASLFLARGPGQLVAFTDLAKELDTVISTFLKNGEYQHPPNPHLNGVWNHLEKSDWQLSNKDIDDLFCPLVVILNAEIDVYWF